MNSITINGTTITSSKNIVITNGKVFVNGTDVTPDSKEINISVVGQLDKLEVDSCSKIEVTGDVNNIKTISGDVGISGNCNGNIQTMSGDVYCESVGGSISTMSGDIKHRK